MGGVASSVAALGSGSADGDIGFIRVTQGGENFMLKLIWDAVNSKWVTQPITAIRCNDGDFVSTQYLNPTLPFVFFGQKNSALSRWYLRSGAIPFAGALAAAGLKLQDRASARIRDSGTKVVRVAPWFYEYNDGDVLVFDNDHGPGNAAFTGKTWAGIAMSTTEGYPPSSGNLGHGCILVSGSTNASRLYFTGSYDDGISGSGYVGLTRNAGWDDVKFFVATVAAGSALGGPPTSTPTVPTKKFLYPTLYGGGTTVVTQGVAAYEWQYRWTS